jgi:hypothetical protein
LVARQPQASVGTLALREEGRKNPEEARSLKTGC